jgi:hypothetical protein
VNATPATGRLKVDVVTPGPYSLDAPINVIDAATLQLVETSKCNTEISLPVGTYVVTTTLPSGERSQGVAEVLSDELAELALTVAEPAVESPAPGGGGLESLGPTRGEVTRSAAAPAPAPTWHLRFHVRTHDGAFQPDEPHVSVVSRVPDRVELEISASGEGLLFAQVAAAGETPLNVALPIYGPTISQRCRLTIEPGKPSTTVNVSLPDNPRVDAVASYLNGGFLQEAADLSAEAEQLMQAKMADPFGAALGGYALIRLGRLDMLHHWPRNLADWFPWLPDGAIIAGEESALEGDHETAIVQVCEAGRRGLPVFSAGLSLLASRLREYAAAPTDAFGANGDRVAEAGELLKKILNVMPFAQFDRVSLAFRGERVDNPASSQTSVSDFRSGGWRNVGEL